MVASRDVVAVEAEVGIDWITATVNRGVRGYQSAYRTMETALEGVYKSTGETPEKRSMLGYHGASCSGGFAGERYDGAMCQFSGSVASSVASILMTNEDLSPSRLDLQITARMNNDADIDAMIVKDYKNAKKAAEEMPEACRRKVYRFSGSDGSETVYIGSPKSPNRGRIYNKGKESGIDEYSRCIRWEIQYRDEYAKAAWKELRAKEGGSKQCVLGAVRAWFAGRGCASIRLIDENGCGLVDPKARSTDNERRLEWLRTQVSPAVQKLLLDVDISVIMEALGLK